MNLFTTFFYIKNNSIRNEIQIFVHIELKFDSKYKFHFENRSEMKNSYRISNRRSIYRFDIKNSIDDLFKRSNLIFSIEKKIENNRQIL